MTRDEKSNSINEEKCGLHELKIHPNKGITL